MKFNDENRETGKLVKLVEPNHGQIVTLQIMIDKYAHFPQNYREQLFQKFVKFLSTYAETINAKITVSGTSVTFTCPDLMTAESVREIWR